MRMKLGKTRIALLLLSGALLILVGASIIVSPAGFYASNNIDLGVNVSLLNELKAPAGLLLVAGTFMIVAAFVRSLGDIALQLATLVYLSYAATRCLSVIVDGVPALGLIQAMALEAAIGLACLLVLMSRLQSKTADEDTMLTGS